MSDAGALTAKELSNIGVDALKSVGTKRRGELAKLGLKTVFDLLHRYPRRYIDRSRTSSIATLVAGDDQMVIANVQRIETRRARRGRPFVTARVADESGSLTLTFFNQPWRERQLTVGTTAVIFGKVSEYRGAPQMTNPVVDLVGTKTGRFVPVYPMSDKVRLTSDDLSNFVAEALRRCASRGFADPVPSSVLERFDLVSRGEALTGIHQPRDRSESERARTRLVFDELLRLQLVLVDKKLTAERETTGIVHQTSPAQPGELVEAFWGRLAFEMTNAQRSAIAEILADLAAPAPMHRLLQGDVGSGKTVVAASALLAAVQGGSQAALMAPTEVLAEQHFAGLRSLLDGIEIDGRHRGAQNTLLATRPIRIELFSNRTTTAGRRKMLQALATGEIDIAVGTHALIQKGVDFNALGLAVVDEQHRFGVEQRSALRDERSDGTVPDVLVMTATPIPRSAAMTVYGDLDISILDEMPPGRTPIETRWANTQKRVADAWSTVRDEVTAGRQAYVVCALVEDSEQIEAASAERTAKELGAGPLEGLVIGLIHGRLSAVEKDAVMTSFRRGETQVLVATTVIEVGVDVPNATVMVILDADRFGIAQLHQLRGRVGRGSDKSYCVLVADDPGDEARARLEALVRTTDGFELAETDLELRGSGTILGERQSGRSDLRLTSLRRDRIWVDRARETAFELIDDKSLSQLTDLDSEIGAFLQPEDTEFLGKS